MGTYGYRLRFLVREGTRIHADVPSLEISLSSTNNSVRLIAIGEPPPLLKDATNLVLRGSGVNSKDEAYNLGQRVKQALLLCSTKLQLGVDTGKDRSTLQFSQQRIDSAKEAGYNLMADVHGLCVFPEELPPRFFFMSAKLAVGKSAASFGEEFMRAYEVVGTRGLSKKEALALGLYNLSLFEASLSARYLTLISAVECITTRAKQSDDVVAHVNSLIIQTKELYKGNYKQSLLSRVSDLKKESISAACRRLVGEHLGDEERKEFSSHYDARSKIVHTGEAPASVDLSASVSQLDGLVSRLLVAVVTSH